MNQSNGNGSASVRVEIYDQTYHLRGSDPEYIAKLAAYVDTKMRLISQQAATVDSLRVAVLAALNIADEFHVLKRKYDGVAWRLQRPGRAVGEARSMRCWPNRDGQAELPKRNSRRTLSFRIAD